MSEWIKWVKGLEWKSETIAIAAATGLPPIHVAGALMTLWAWADDNCDQDGRDAKASAATIDLRVGIPGFAAAMQAAGWLEECADGGIAFPRFDRHNGYSAKTRAMAAGRQSSARRAKTATPVTQEALHPSRKSVTPVTQKCDTRHAPTVTPVTQEALPEEREKREEKRINTDPPTPLGGAVGVVLKSMMDSGRQATQAAHSTNDPETNIPAANHTAARQARLDAFTANWDELARLWPRPERMMFAREVYLRLVTGGIDHAEVMAGVRAHQEAWALRPTDKWPELHRWLSERRWQERPVPATATGSSEAVGADGLTAENRALARRLQAEIDAENAAKAKSRNQERDHEC